MTETFDQCGGSISSTVLNERLINRECKSPRERDLRERWRVALLRSAASLNGLCDSDPVFVERNALWVSKRLVTGVFNAPTYLKPLTYIGYKNVRDCKLPLRMYYTRNCYKFVTVEEDTLLFSGLHSYDDEFETAVHEQDDE